MHYLEALSRRYSVKKFNHQIIPQETLHNILESGKLSASSLGLQLEEIYFSSYFIFNDWRIRITG